MLKVVLLVVFSLLLPLSSLLHKNTNYDSKNIHTTDTGHCAAVPLYRLRHDEGTLAREQMEARAVVAAVHRNACLHSAAGSTA